MTSKSKKIIARVSRAVQLGMFILEQLLKINIFLKVQDFWTVWAPMLNNNISKVKPKFIEKPTTHL
jgi:hypothetical protein